MEELKQFGVIPVDVAALETVFSSYSFPQKKITTLEQTGKLIRLKRGLYVVAPGVSGRILSEELIANHLWGLRMCLWKRHFGITDRYRKTYIL